MSAQLESVLRVGTPARPNILRRLWRRLPQRTRIKLQSELTRLIAPTPDKIVRGGFPLGIAGLFSSAGGLGEGARLAYTALDAAGFAPAAFDLSATFGQTEFSSPISRRMLAAGSGSLIVHHNGPYMSHAMWALGRAKIHERRIIGYWAWELPQLPPMCRPGLRFVHEIWVPSSFTRDAIAAATDLPVHVVPHPVPAMPATPDMRRKLNLPEDTLVVLNVFHMGSAFTRKNPLAAIAAFRRAFGDAPDRVLAIKVIDDAAGHARHQLGEAIAGATNIRLIEGMLSPADMTGLMAASDVVISLHRSEGFGLVLAQAMSLGKAVVATGWSGNLDFMTERNSALVPYSLVPVDDPDGAFDADGQSWADANIDAAAAWLRQLAGDPDLRARLGTVAARDIAARLSPERFAATVAALIEPDRR